MDHQVQIAAPIFVEKNFKHPLFNYDFFKMFFSDLYTENMFYYTTIKPNLQIILDNLCDRQ